MHTRLALIIVVAFFCAGGAACGDKGSGAPDASFPDANPADARPRPDADPGAIPRAEPVGCRYQVPDELALTEDVDYDCGDLIVYENRDDPTATIRVHYIRFDSPSSSNNATIYLDGGPGGNGQNILSYVGYLGTSFLQGLLVDGDFLVISQRGTSLSVPSLVDELGDADLPSYNTGYNADDVDDLRASLGYDALNVYGISYGSRLGLEVLRRHGDKVRSAVLGGLVPAQINWPAAVPASFYSSLTALNASCADDGGCAAAFGNLESKFTLGFDVLNNSPVVFDYLGDEIYIDGWTYSSLLFQLLYSKSTFPWLPFVISDLAQSRTDRVGDFIGEMLVRFGGDSDLSQGLYYSVVCGELFNPPDAGAFDAANAGVPSAILDIFGYNWYGMLDACENWPLGDPTPELSQPVLSGVRTLISSGAIDPITPPTFGDVAAEGLSDRVVVVFANSGHGATLQSDCGRSSFLAFLADPTATPDTSCAAGVTTNYVLPGSLTAWSVPWKAIGFELDQAMIPPDMRRRLRDAVRQKN